MLVLGSGVIGVTSAYYLAQAGHEVTVVDRQAEPALETSFANAGEVSPGYSSPWAGPGVPVKAIKWLLMKHGPLVIRPKLDPVMWLWLLKMLRNCTSERYAINKSRMIPIAEYSRDCLRALRAEIGIKYDERSQGTLQLFRKQAQLDGTADDIAVLKQYGVPYEVLDRAGCIAAEPALAAVDGQDRRRAAAAAGRDRRLPHVYPGAGRSRRKARRAVRFGTGDRAVDRRRRRDHRRRDQRGRVAGRRLCDGARQLVAAVAAAARHFDPGLSGEGLFDHRADRRCRRRAGVDRDGRKLQGRDHAARRSHPRRRHRRSFRLFRQALCRRGGRRSIIR